MNETWLVYFVIGMVGGLLGLALSSRGTSGPPLLAILFDRDGDSAAIVGIGGAILIALVVGLHFAYAYSR